MHYRHATPVACLVEGCRGLWSRRRAAAGQSTVSSIRRRRFCMSGIAFSFRTCVIFRKELSHGATRAQYSQRSSRSMWDTLSREALVVRPAINCATAMSTFDAHDPMKNLAWGRGHRGPLMTEVA